MDEWLQCEGPALDVLIAPVTAAWAVLTLTGPQARAVLQSVGGDIDLSPAAFPHMAYREGRVAGHQARVLRASFTGEVSFEVSVAWDQAEDLWDRLAQAGAPFGMAPVGIDAWMLLRTEKGYLHVGTDTDGSTAPADIGWERTFRRRDEFIGRRSLTRPDNLRIVALERAAGVPLVQRTTRSVVLTDAGRELVADAAPAFERIDAGFTAVKDLSGTPRGTGRVTAPGAYDPQGERLNG